MNENVIKKVKYGLFAIVAIVIIFLLYKGATYVYRNSYVNEIYKYAQKSSSGMIFDQNVVIEKNTKRNNVRGEIRLVFDKKELDEEHQFTLGSEISSTNVEVSVVGKINAGNMKVELIDGNGKVIFERIVDGENIKEISKADAYSKNYKLLITPSGAQNGDITVSFRFR